MLVAQGSFEYLWAIQPGGLGVGIGRLKHGMIDRNRDLTFSHSTILREVE